ncbi:phage tail protein [Parasedimentitalea marina]|uniref:Phage tail protein n=1 Tax=Parasedimentitalea marina TaxID=2483033 RepID=A0A3T0N1I9_9RHOB|nr:tail protein X [Parasedimentitalea marina]AZV77875.1 phage tail protein [Parasedimentitalea marina]
MTNYRTKDGDMVDAICRSHYGSEAMVELVYEANPGLAKRGPVLPLGLVLILPEKAVEPVAKPLRLWG